MEMRRRIGIWLWVWFGWDGIVAHESKRLHEEIIKRFKADEDKEASDRTRISDLEEGVADLRLQLKQIQDSGLLMKEKPKPVLIKARSWREVQNHMREDEDVSAPHEG